MTPNKRVKIHVIKGTEAKSIFHFARKMDPQDFSKWPDESACCQANIMPRVVQSLCMGMESEMIAPCCTLCQLLETAGSIDEMMDELSAEFVEISLDKMMNSAISSDQHDENMADVEYFIKQLKILYNGVEA